MRSVLSVSLPRKHIVRNSISSQGAQAEPKVTLSRIDQSLPLGSTIPQVAERVGAKAKKAGLVSEEDVFKANRESRF